MNFEGFQDLMRRIARTWYERAKVEVNIEINIEINSILSNTIIILTYVFSFRY